MGFTIEDAFIQCGEQYKLKLLAGKNGCANSISWIHLIEDTTIIQQLWGKELAVTTGLGFQSDAALFHFIEKLVQHHSTGLIINTGKYIFNIPDYIIDYCNEQEFPLITIPWEIHLADVIKDFSMRCIISDREDQQFSKYFKKIIANPETIETYRNEIMDFYDVDGYFQILLVSIENSNQFDSIELRRVSFQLELYFEKIDAKYNFFWFDSYFVLILNNMTGDVIKLTEKMYQRVKKRMPGRFIHVGIGSQVKDISNIAKTFNRAKAAVEYAIKFDEYYQEFDEMGIYQILFSVEDQNILEKISYNQLRILTEYDEKHHTELEKTLYFYINYNASIQKIASAMYTHRNTINYRITKIKQLLDSDIDTPEERFQYMLAFYIKEMLQR